MFVWCLDWIVDIIQNPGAQRPGTSLAVQGDKGTGKGAIFNTIQDLFGVHAYHTSNMNELTGGFNAHLQRVVFLFCDESLWSGDKASEGVLKRLITESTLNVTYKGFDTFKAPNRLRIGIASNEDWIVPTSEDERRFCVCKISNIRIKDEDWFDRVYKPNLSDLLDEMINHNIVSKLRQAPSTEALAEQINQSRDIVSEFYLELGDTNPEFFGGAKVPVSIVWETFTSYYGRHRAYGYLTPLKFSKKLTALGKPFNDVRKVATISGKSTRCIIFGERVAE